MDIDVGQVLAGKYELVRLIGQGAMGQVWLATHNSLGGEFAVKLVDTTEDYDEDQSSGRFQLEAQIAAKLSRKTRHIVAVSDHGEEGPLAYLVMELLDGESLEQRIARHGVRELPEVVAMVQQVSRGLSLAHADGVFHRDLKPANVFLTRDEDERMLVKLLDFGIARSIKPVKTRSAFATSKDMVLGTPSYMSPEQARGLATLDHRCDLWSLAVVAYEALVGRIPFEGQTIEDIFLSICTYKVTPIRTLRTDLPPGIDAFFARAFAADVDARFSTAAEMADHISRLVEPEALEAAVGGRPLSASSRRLLAAPPAPSSSPVLGAAPGISDPRDPFPSAHDGDGAVVGYGTGRIPKDNTGRVALIAGGAVAVIALLGVVAFVAGRRDGSDLGAKHSPVTAPPATAPGPEVPTATPTPITAEPAPTTTASTTAKTKPPTPVARPAPSTTNAPSTAPAVAAPPVVVTPKPHPSAKTIDKSEVL